MSVLGYARASTAAQHASPQLQADEIRQYAERAGLCGSHEVEMYVDPAISARYNAIDQREAGMVMCRRLQHGDVVIFHRFDRGFRNMRDFVNTMEDWVKKGVKLHLVHSFGGMNVVDYATPYGKFFVQICAAVAEFDNDLRRERIKEAVAARRATGIAIRSKPPIGYRWSAKKVHHPYAKNKVHVLVPCEIERDACRFVVTMRNTTNLNWYEIADALLVWLGGRTIPLINKVCDRTAKRYYDRMKEWGMVHANGLPHETWTDPPHLAQGMEILKGVKVE